MTDMTLADFLEKHYNWSILSEKEQAEVLGKVSHVFLTTGAEYLTEQQRILFSALKEGSKLVLHAEDDEAACNLLEESIKNAKS